MQNKGIFRHAGSQLYLGFQLFANMFMSHTLGSALVAWGLAHSVPSWSWPLPRSSVGDSTLSPIGCHVCAVGQTLTTHWAGLLVQLEKMPSAWVFPQSDTGSELGLVSGKYRFQRS